MSETAGKNRNRVVCFGEIMMRLNPEGYGRFVQADRWEVTYAGAEANVAVALSCFGLDAAFVSRVPEHEIGQCAVNALRRFGVDTGCMLRGGDRLGVYYCEKGASQRPSRVIYDRAGSAIALAQPGDFDWDAIFLDADWFHWTGITPALGGRLPEICLDACRAARERGIPVSCDLNYRKKLWSRETAGEIMGRLMPFVDVCIANEEDARDVFGIEAPGSDVQAGRLNHEGYVAVARELATRFGCRKVAVTLRGSISASENDWAGMLYDSTADCAVFSPGYRIRLVDRVGGGDSFGGGLIYSLLEGFDDRKAIDFAVAASCLKQTIEHDFNLVSVAEVEALAAGNASGRVVR
ncbi:MAG: sugar kinase [Oscillospiraceae bacterium]|nr:sugar kinase [Oscillospiraceae bacterium]